MPHGRRYMQHTEAKGCVNYKHSLGEHDFKLLFFLGCLPVARTPGSPLTIHEKTDSATDLPIEQVQWRAHPRGPSQPWASTP